MRLALSLADDHGHISTFILNESEVRDLESSVKRTTLAQGLTEALADWRSAHMN